MTDSGKGSKSSMRDLMKANRRGNSVPPEGEDNTDPKKRKRKQTSYTADVEIWDKAMLIADHLHMDKGEAIDEALRLFGEKYSTVFEMAIERQNMAERLKKAREL